MQAAVDLGDIKFDEKYACVWVIPPKVVDEMQPHAHCKAVDAGVQLLPYDSLVECMRVPFWKGEVMEESCFDGEFYQLVKCRLAFETKGVELSIF